MVAKRKVSLSLDADLIDELERFPEDGVSGQVNKAVRAEIERRRAQRALKDLLDRLEAENGPLGSADEGEIARFERALGGRDPLP